MFNRGCSLPSFHSDPASSRILDFGFADSCQRQVSQKLSGSARAESWEFLVPRIAMQSLSRMRGKCTSKPYT